MIFLIFGNLEQSSNKRTFVIGMGCNTLALEGRGMGEGEKKLVDG